MEVLQQAIDIAIQKGCYSLHEVRHIINSLDAVNAQLGAVNKPKDENNTN